MANEIHKTIKRTALLIYCTPEEAEQVKRAAKRERRTISGFVMNAVMARFAAQAEVQARLGAVRK